MTTRVSPVPRRKAGSMNSMLHRRAGAPVKRTGPGFPSPDHGRATRGCVGPLNKMLPMVMTRKFEKMADIQRAQAV